MARRTNAAVLALLVGIVLGSGLPARAATPTEELRRYTDRVLQVLQSSALSARDKRTAVRELAVEIFDVGETARRALGVHWQRRTAAERAEFVRLFQDLLELTYIHHIDEYGGEGLRYVDERVEGDGASVRAVLVTRSGLEVPVESRLVRKADRWRVYDVLVANVSLVANYRSQFDRVIRSSSYGELVKRIRTRVQLLGDGPPGAGLGAEPARR